MLSIGIFAPVSPFGRNLLRGNAQRFLRLLIEPHDLQYRAPVAPSTYKRNLLQSGELGNRRRKDLRFGGESIHEKKVKKVNRADSAQGTKCPRIRFAARSGQSNCRCLTAARRAKKTSTCAVLAPFENPLCTLGASAPLFGSHYTVGNRCPTRMGLQATVAILAPCGYSIGSSKASPIHEHCRGSYNRERSHKEFVPRSRAGCKSLNDGVVRIVAAVCADPTMPVDPGGRDDHTNRRGV